MKLPRDLAGRALVKVLSRDWGYRVVHQEGSHIILDTEEPSHQRIPIPERADFQQYDAEGQAITRWDGHEPTLSIPNPRPLGGLQV